MPSQAMEMLKKVMQQMMTQGMTPKFDGNFDVQQMRAVMGAAQSRMPTDPGVTFEPCTLNGVEAELNIPENARTDAVVIYYPDCFHAFATSGRGTPESAEVLQKTIYFINEHI